MASPVLEIFFADALAGHRNMMRRLNRNRLYTVWSLALMTAAFGAVAGIISFITSSPEAEGFPLELNDALFLFFLVFMGKSLLDAYHYLVERPASVFLLVQPFGSGPVVLGKMLSIAAFNMALLAFGLGTLTGMTMLHPSLHFIIPPDIVLDLIILSLLATLVGFTYAVLSGLGSWPRKVAAGAAFSPVMSLMYIVMGQVRLGGWELTQTLVALLVLAAIGIPISAFFLLESWNTMTTSKSMLHPVRRSSGRGRTAGIVERRFGAAVAAVYDCEVRTLLRRREGIGNAITLAGLLAFAVYFYREFRDFLGFDAYIVGLIPILVVGLALYLAVVSLGLVPALGAFSRDGKGAWVYRVSPVRESEIVKGKALAVMLMLPFVLACVAVPIPLVSGLGGVAMLFSGMGGAAMFLAAAGMGLWYGARSPNFDESSGNAPDVMTMYTFMLLTLFLSALMLLPPLALAFEDKVLGFLGLVLALDFSALVLWLGLRGAAKGLARLEMFQ